MSDSSTYRKWQITDNHRNIAGFSCRKAVFSPDDSTRIYAWYADEVMPSVGPESFGGLPGAILGLASEDGGIIYFAKTVEQTKPLTEVLSPPKKKQKIYARAELKSKLEQQYGENKYGKRMIKNLFGYW